MEVIEILVFIGISIILGVLVLGFLTDWDYKQGYDDIKKMMIEDENQDFERLDKEEFAAKLQSKYHECLSSGVDTSFSLYLNDNGTLSKQELFNIYKELGWCETIQSASNNCGKREDVDMIDITLPKVVIIECTNNTLKLS